MPKLMGHHAAENSSGINLEINVQLLHSFPEYVAIPTVLIGVQERDPERRVAAWACYVRDDVQHKSGRLVDLATQG
jgi:hypothetical protein